ncbi:MAG TPA: DUF1800 family protein [Polyangiaceae bacterium]|nr:DUF1800 family protein [Polyangiaceae bacterium]
MQMDHARFWGRRCSSTAERWRDRLKASWCPSTARFIATKLAQKFVSDEPPQSLVERLAGTFSASYGDLSRVYADLFASPEFAASAEQKTKTPLEFVLSALRAVGASYDGSKPLAKVLEQMGQPLYQAEAPTGYREVASAWVNAGGLVARLNFALSLAENSLEGVHFEQASLLGDLEGAPADWLDRLAMRVLVPPLSESTRRTIVATLAREAETKPPDDGLVLQRQALGLLLGSPEFQRQ